MEEKSDNPPSSPSISTVTTDSETETWEVVEDKDDDKEQKSQQNPKITIDKAESTDNDDEGDADGKKKEKSSSLSVGSSSRVEEVKDGKISYDDFSDGISVISESEMECHHDVDTTLEDEPEAPAKKELMLKSPMMVCPVRDEQMPLLEYLQQYFMNNQLASMAILALLVAVVGGLFCQIAMIFSSSATTEPSTCPSDVNLLICENKLKEFERDNANLRIEISILQKEIEDIRGKCVAAKEENAKEDTVPVRTKAINGQYKGKRVKTKYDAFKRPPVAAGGEEETFIHVDKPLLVDEDEPPLTTWTDFIEPLQNLWTEGAPNDEIIVEDEVETNYEPVDVDTETNPTLNELPEDEKSPIPEPNEKKFDKKSSWKQKNEQNDKKFENKKAQKFDEKPKRDEKYQEKHNKDQKKRSKEASGAGEYKQEQKWKKYDEHGSGDNSYKVEKSKDNDDDNHHDKHKRDNSDEENDFWKQSHEKSYQKRRSNDRNESRKDSSGEKYKREKHGDSREKSSWHDDRMKNREKHRDRDNSEENWYVERKKNREKHRESREKDSNWYIERNLERELLRSREHDTSKERSK
ncbi:uncharacterized protein LOC134836771 isoform X2 [Culicoides brevitarsis]|uniref:uncharacterized protein LOC134836771 isoform X2 n=1 Tax=Culicoides brevitarsis TaxID=469753 RepID=UPI00307B9919